MTMMSIKKGRGRPPKVRGPVMEGMLQVTAHNRKKLEQQLGASIPEDVEYILMPNQLEKEEFWDIEQTCHIKREHRGDTDTEGIEKLE